MTLRNNIIIIGGGLAGMAAAIHLSLAGLQVTLIEKNKFPRHKVCGEYISNEVLPYLRWLGADPAELGVAGISRVLVSSVSGKTMESVLPLGGFGVSRYALDHFLMKRAVAAGVEWIEDTVTDVRYEDNRFAVQTLTHGQLQAEVALGAYGKRAALDQRLSRGFLQRKSPWLAVKGHYEGTFPDGLVALHNFSGGYCGVSKVEQGILNICYLVSYDSFRRYANIDTHRQEVLCRNIYLKNIFDNSRPLFEQPLTISQVSFEEKTKVEQHMLMLGDTAGLIHPLCGNGMAMAIDSARMAAEGVLQYFRESGYTRHQLETDYTHRWNKTFGRRVQTGRLLNDVFLKDKLSAWLVQGLASFPSVLPFIIRQTHGKPLKVTYT